MTEEQQLDFGSLHQLGTDAEHLLAMNFGDRSGQARLFAAEQFTLIDATFGAATQRSTWQHYNHRPLVELNFVLGGQLRQSHSGLLRQQAYVDGYHNCLFNPDSLEENELMGDKPFHMLSLQLEPDEMIRLLTSYAPDLDEVARKLVDRIPFVYQSPALHYPEAVRYRLQTLWQSPGNPNLKRLHFDSVMLQLLCYQFDQLLQARIDKPTAVKRSDEDKLYHARELLLEKLSEPPRLGSLARACQLNEFSLKRGFKQLFGTTVYGFVLKQRMEAARMALLAGEKTISEIAYELGYAHAQHFHRAFKSQYGVTPRALKAR